MVRLGSLVTLLLSLAILGCGANEAKKADPPQKRDLPPTIASLNEETISNQNAVAAILEGVKSKSDAEGAKGKLETINKKAKDLDGRTQTFLKDKKGEDVNIDMMDWLLANEEKVRAAIMRYEKAVSDLPADAKVILKDLLP